jgi:hypothetical protein
MVDVKADQHHAPETVATVAGMARRIFARYRVEFSEARRAGGWSNLTWLGGGLALRISAEAGALYLLREARLAALLPPSSQPGAAPAAEPKGRGQAQNTKAAQAKRKAEAAARREAILAKREATAARKEKPRTPRSDKGVKRGPCAKT